MFDLVFDRSKSAAKLVQFLRTPDWQYFRLHLGYIPIGELFAPKEERCADANYRRKTFSLNDNRRNLRIEEVNQYE